MGCPFEGMIKEIDWEAYLFLRNLDSAICLTDDLIDHKVNPVKSIDVLLHLNAVTELALKKQDYLKALERIMIN